MSANKFIEKCFNNVKKKIKYIIYSIKYFFMKKRKFNIIDNDDTIKKIVDEGYSICRYGDGEFQWILGEKLNSFQDNSVKMAEELRKIFEEYDTNDKILIGINNTLNTLNGLTFDAKFCWKEFVVKFGKSVYKILPDMQYCDTGLTRPYMDFKNKNKEIMKKKFENLKKIWDSRNVVIVEGEFTKLGIDNDLFDNCESIKRIICPAKNAYFKYDEILASIMQHALKSDLILLSLGPTATILAYNLAKMGYQSIDTGHVDIEYMWFKKNCYRKEAIAGKYVNEVEQKEPGISISDEVSAYEKQIIAKIL